MQGCLNPTVREHGLPNSTRKKSKFERRCKRQNLPVKTANFMANYAKQRAGRLDEHRLASGTEVAVNPVYALGTNPCVLTWRVCYWSTSLPFARVLQLPLTLVLP